MNDSSVILGNIVTMNEKQPRVQAMAIKDGTIAFLGTKEETLSFAGPGVEVIDFGTSTVYPGMVDTHSHLGLMTTIMGGGPVFEYGDTYENNVRDMTEFIKANPGREFYKGYGMTPNPKRGFPTHQMLDAIEVDGKKVDKPIIIFEVSGHSEWMNQAAMNELGVNKELVKKYREDVVPCDDNGEPIGCLKETPHYAVVSAIPYELDEVKKLLLKFQEDHLANGFSMIGDCGINEGPNPMVTAMSQLAEEGKLKVKVRAYYQIFETSKDPLKEVDRAVEFAKKYNYDTFKIVGIKIFLDGGNEGMTSWTINPYVGYKYKGKPYFGYNRWSYERIDELASIIRKANENGLSMEFHAIGSGAARYALDAIEKAQKGIKNPDFRNAVSHLYYVDKKDIPRFAKMNVTAVTAPHWYVFMPTAVPGEKLMYGDPEKDQCPEGQSYLNIGPLQSYLDTGANMAFHSDGDSLSSPSRILFAAVNKYDGVSDPNMEPRNIKERVSPWDALKCMTINPAYVLKEEKNVGSLEPGKKADFVVYDVDFTDEKVIADPKVSGISPKSLYINGKKIF